MKNLAKLSIVFVFALSALLTLLQNSDFSGLNVLAQTANRPAATPTPAANANTKPAATPEAASGKTIPKNFVLGKDSASEHGEVAFDHETHAFKNYSPDGKSVIGCVECHHTDQPKSALTPPLVTSERDVVLTIDSWKASSKKVSECRVCHFQDGNVPDGKTMPTAAVTVAGKATSKELNNELAYHLNCNTCHDAAAKLRPELKGKKTGFAIGNDCFTCHKQN